MNYSNGFEFLLGMFKTFADIGSWFVTELGDTGLTPLGLFTAGGLVAIIAIHAFKLMNPLS